MSKVHPAIPVIEYRSSPPVLMVLLPHVPIVAWIAYRGWVGLFTGGITFDADLPTWLIYMWTFALALGGTFSCFGALLTRTRLESAGLGVVCMGLAVFGLTGIFDHAQGLFALEMISLALAAMCGIRLRVLSLARQAHTQAFHIRQEREDGRE